MGKIFSSTTFIKPEDSKISKAISENNYNCIKITLGMHCMNYFVIFINFVLPKHIAMFTFIRNAET